jgi:hypothetical protein
LEQERWGVCVYTGFESATKIPKKMYFVVLAMIDWVELNVAYSVYMMIMTGS